MANNTMNHETGYGNVFGTTLAVIFCFISRFTLNDLAAVAAILAGLTTAGYNVWRFLKERKKHSNEQHNSKP